MDHPSTINNRLSQNSMLRLPPKKLVGFIHSSVNFPVFTQTINASFSFPILRAIAIDVSFPKRLNCKTRPLFFNLMGVL
jgi:hypothetical protein